VTDIRRKSGVCLFPGSPHFIVSLYILDSTVTYPILAVIRGVGRGGEAARGKQAGAGSRPGGAGKEWVPHRKPPDRDESRSGSRPFLS
jgi:hypothetical protein